MHPTDVIGAVAEVFTWVGLGAGVLLGILALVLHLADGQWLPARGVVEETDAGPAVRWIDADGGVCEAPLSEHDVQRIAGADMADIHYRRGRRDLARLTPGSPAVRATATLAVGLGAVGAVALIVNWALLALAD